MVKMYKIYEDPNPTVIGSCESSDMDSITQMKAAQIINMNAPDAPIVCWIVYIKDIS